MKLLSLVLVSLMFASCAHKEHHSCGGGNKHEDHFAKMDVNHDGKISKDEMIKGHADKFSAMDLNKDGFLTLEEMTAAHKEMQNTCESCKK